MKMSDLTRPYTVVATLLTLYAIWVTGNYIRYLYLMTLMQRAPMPAFMIRIVPWWDLVGGLLGPLAWWVMAYLGWLLRTDYAQRARAASVAASVQEDQVWPPRPSMD